MDRRNLIAMHIGNYKKKGTTFHIEVGYTLPVLKSLYRKQFGMGKHEKVYKKDLQTWLTSLIEGDLEIIDGDEG